MNLVGKEGKGESVWLAFFLYDVLQRFAELARAGRRRGLCRALRQRRRRCCSRTSRRTGGTATGTGAPTSTTARRSARPPTRNARSTPSPRAGRCCRARRSGGRGQAMDGGGPAPGPARRAADPALRSAVRHVRARARLHQGLHARRARERRPVHPRRDLGRHGLRELGDTERAWELFSHAQPDPARDGRRRGRTLQGRALRRVPPTSTAWRRTPAAAAGPGTRARPAGCTG
jgi:hypothetical protein